MAAAPEAPPVAAPASPAQINASQMPSPVSPSTPAAPGSAREKFNQILRGKAKPENADFGTPADPPVKPAVTPKPAEPLDDPVEPADPPTGEPAPAEPTPPAEGTPPAAAKKKPNKDFWRSFDEYKARATKAEAELVELKKGIAPEQDRKTWEDRIAATDKRNKELEDHIRYVDFSKSKEFQDGYVRPYEDAWKRAVTELSELRVIESEDGETTRAAKAEDLLALVNLPLGEARGLADKMFGPFANDMMGFRNEIRKLADAQHAALETAKTSLGEVLKKRSDDHAAATKNLNSFIADTWTKVSNEALNDPKYSKFFKEEEGDAEGNARLQKGYKFVDEAFAMNPQNPSLSPQERVAAIRKHVALRNRAAITGKLFLHLDRANKKVAELEKKLAEYKESAPPGGAPTPVGQPNGNGNPTAWNQLSTALRSRAK